VALPHDGREVVNTAAKPVVRGNVCLNCDPDGLERELKAWIDIALQRKYGKNGPVNVLVIEDRQGMGSLRGL
jgi:trans-2-enoyl-CoA reductase